MDDLAATISQVLSDPEKVKQIQAVAASLGLGQPDEAAAQPEAGGGNNSADPPEASAQQSQTEHPAPGPSSGSGPDLSALSGLLGGLGGGGSPDLSLLSGLLSGLAGNSGGDRSQGGGGGFNVASLAGLLRAGNPQTSGEAGSQGGFDMGMFMNLQQAMANIQANRANIDLLLALKPRLSEKRSKKVDDAIRVMQIIQFLPMIKESGLFGEMDSILSGLTGGLGGGFGNIISGITSGFRR